MQSRIPPGRHTGGGPVPSSSTLPPFLLGASQSPPQRGAFSSGGINQSMLSSTPSSARKHPVSQLNQRSTGSPQSQRKEVSTTAPPVEGLFEPQAACYPLHAGDSGFAASNVGGVANSNMSFVEGPTSVQKFSHLMGDVYSNTASPSLAPVTPFAGTRAPPYVGSPAAQTHSNPVARYQSDVTDSPLAGNGMVDGTMNDRCWVTVFGFPPDAADYILQEFSHCGTIVRHVMDMNTNWMHICYESALQAKKALSKSCKVLMSRIMVGVVPLTDGRVMQPHGSLERSDVATSNSVASPVLTGPGNFGAEQQQRRPSNIRPMTVSYQHGLAGQAVERNDGMPRKADGVIGKAMEYMFGW